jgi:hypothetical protein
MNYKKEIPTKRFQTIINEIKTIMQEEMKKNGNLSKYVNEFEMKIKSASERNLETVILRDINKLKKFAQQMRRKEEENGYDYGREIGDFLYSLETDYQNWYDLDENDWEMC